MSEVLPQHSVLPALEERGTNMVKGEYFHTKDTIKRSCQGGAKAVVWNGYKEKKENMIRTTQISYLGYENIKVSLIQPFKVIGRLVKLKNIPNDIMENLGTT